MRVGAVSLLLAAGLTAGAASGQVVTDGSLGPALALPGPHYQVTAELGTRVGANLFHSFQAFSLEARDGVAESATFTGPGDIARVISRVTGGRPSVIDGSLRCEIGQADFYFLNPAGVVFGPHATVDVPGSLHVATADELRLADGSRFRSGDVDDGQLSWAAPESFGYLSPQPANLILRGAQLRFQPGSEVTLSAGSLLLEGALLDSPGGSLALRARDDAANRVELRDSMALATGGGEIHLSGGRLHLDHSLLDVSAVADLDAGRIDLNGGLVSLVAGSWLDARSQGRGQGGEIAVIGRQMQFLDSRLHAAAEADGDAGTIRIEGGWSRIDDGLVDVSSHGQGRAGRVTVSVDQLELRAGAQIGAASLGGGAGGKIRVHASTGLLIQGEDEDGHDAGLYAHTDAGRAGTIELAAPLIHVLDEGRISVQASAFGAAGAVRINADRLLLEQGGRISAQGYDSFGQGEIQIGVTDLLAIVGKGEAPNPSPGSDTVSTGILSHAARLDIRAAEIRISDSGAIRSESWYQPEPGYIRIAADRILMTSGGHISGSALGHSYTEGVGAPVTIQAGQWLDMSGSANGRETTIASGARSSGASGSVAISTPYLRIADDAVINTNTGVFGTALGGSIDLQVGLLEIAGGGLTTTERGHQRGGGSIRVTASEAIRLSEGVIQALGGNDASAGQILLVAPSVHLDASLISTSNSEQATSGGIRIDTHSLVLERGSGITSDAYVYAGMDSDLFGAGSLDLNVDRLLIVRDSELATRSRSTDGGVIRIAGLSGSLRALVLENGQITTSVLGDIGDGGDIHVQADTLVMETGFIQANTAAIEAAGGDIFVVTDNLLTHYAQRPRIGDAERQEFVADSGVNVIQAAAPGGEQGAIQVTAPDLDLSGSLVRVDSALVDAVRLHRDACAQTAGRLSSSLVEAGRGGLAAAPGEQAGVVLTPARLQRLLPGDGSPWQGPALGAAPGSGKLSGCTRGRVQLKSVGLARSGEAAPF